MEVQGYYVVKLILTNKPGIPDPPLPKERKSILY